MTPDQSKAYNQWIRRNSQLANQEADQSAVRKQVAIEDIIAKLPQVIPLYEADLAS